MLEVLNAITNLLHAIVTWNITIPHSWYGLPPREAYKEKDIYKYISKKKEQ